MEHKQIVGRQPTLQDARPQDLAQHSAMLAHQIELEKLYNKNQTTKRVRQEFLAAKPEFDFIAYMEERKIPIDFGLDLLTQMALHRRCNLPTLIGLLRHHFSDSQITADMFAQAAMADLVDWDPAIEQFIVKFTISDDVQEELDRFQYPLPMVIPPKPVTRNTQTGYILGSGSLLLRDNHHDDDVCLDHINRMNKVRFTIDQDTATMIHNRWRNLDKPKEGETRADFDKRRKAFEKYDRTAKDVMQKISSASEDGTFYLTHKYDKRGRIYCQGYHVNYQGNPWNKAVIQLADKEYVNADG